MADRRMISKQIIDSDVFLDMPQSSQNLYFHLNIRADDEGFVNNPKKIMRVVNSSQNDLEILLDKHYLLDFGTGVVVIKHWKLHNAIRLDRMKPTLYQEEKNQLDEKKNGSYTWSRTNGNQPTTKCPPSIGEVRLGEVNIEKSVPKRKSFSPDLSFIDNDDWRRLYQEWVSNKKSPFKKQVGVHKGYTELLNLSNENIETAQKIIDKSLANNWSGLFELKNNFNKQGVDKFRTGGEEVDW